MIRLNQMIRLKENYTHTCKQTLSGRVIYRHCKYRDGLNVEMKPSITVEDRQERHMPFLRLAGTRFDKAIDGYALFVGGRTERLSIVISFSGPSLTQLVSINPLTPFLISGEC